MCGTGNDNSVDLPTVSSSTLVLIVSHCDTIGTCSVYLCRSFENRIVRGCRRMARLDIVTLGSANSFGETSGIVTVCATKVGYYFC